MAWQPTAEGLQQLLGLFKAAHGADNDAHRAIFDQLRSFNSVPDYNCYLAFILNQMRQEDASVRQTAGLVLKNNVKESWAAVAPEVKQCACASSRTLMQRRQPAPTPPFLLGMAPLARDVASARSLTPNLTAGMSVKTC